MNPTDSGLSAQIRKTADAADRGLPTGPKKTFKNQSHLKTREYLAFKIAQTQEPSAVLRILAAKFKLDDKTTAQLFSIDDGTEEFKGSLSVQEALRIAKAQDIPSGDILFFVNSGHWKHFAASAQESGQAVDLNKANQNLTVGARLTGTAAASPALDEKIELFEKQVAAALEVEAVKGTTVFDFKQASAVRSHVLVKIAAANNITEDKAANLILPGTGSADLTAASGEASNNRFLRSAVPNEILAAREKVPSLPDEFWFSFLPPSEPSLTNVLFARLVESAQQRSGGGALSLADRIKSLNLCARTGAGFPELSDEQLAVPRFQKAEPAPISSRLKTLGILTSGFVGLSSAKVVEIRLECLKRVAQVNGLASAREAFAALWPRNSSDAAFARVCPVNPPDRLAGMTRKVLFRALYQAPDLPPELYLAFSSMKSPELFKGACSLFMDRNQEIAEDIGAMMHQNRRSLSGGGKIQEVDPHCFALSDDAIRALHARKAQQEERQRRIRERALQREEKRRQALETAMKSRLVREQAAGKPEEQTLLRHTSKKELAGLLMSAYRDLGLENLLLLRKNFLKLVSEANSLSSPREALDCLWPASMTAAYQRYRSLLPGDSSRRLSGFYAKVMFRALAALPKPPIEQLMLFASFSGVRSSPQVFLALVDKFGVKASQSVLSWVLEAKKSLQRSEPLPAVPAEKLVIAPAVLEKFKSSMVRPAKLQSAKPRKVSKSQTGSSCNRQGLGHHRVPTPRAHHKPPAVPLWSGPRIIPKSEFTLSRVDKVPARKGKISGTKTIAILGTEVFYTSHGIKEALADISESHQSIPNTKPSQIPDDACLADFIPGRFDQFSIELEQVRFQLHLNRYYGIFLPRLPPVNADIDEIMELIRQPIENSWFFNAGTSR